MFSSKVPAAATARADSAKQLQPVAPCWYQNLKWPCFGSSRACGRPSRPHTAAAMLRSAPRGKAMSSLTISHHGAAGFAASTRFQPPAQPEFSGTRTTRISGRSRFSTSTAAPLTMSVR